MTASTARTILFALLAGLPVSAGADPTQPGELLNALETSSSCATCHAFPVAPEHAGEPNYSPMVWQGSLMANAARDPVFWAGVAIADQDVPGGTQDCVRCHAPRAFLEGRGDATAVDELEPDDRAGIECDLCHRMIDDGTTPPGNAQYVVDDAAVAGKVPKRGPWSYSGDEPDHPWIDDDTFTASSRLCGTCHDVSTPRERVDENGVGMGFAFNEQRTYSEWVNSDVSGAATCQDCHLPAIEDAAGCASFSTQGLAHATGARRHDLVGANRFMLDVLARLYGDAGTGEVADGFFDHTRAQTDELVRTAATLEVAFPDAVDLGEGLPSLPVTVTNETGHKLPTGYSEGRVMWLEVTATYGEVLVWSSGRWADGAIEDDPQVRRYEAIAEDHDDGTTLHLLRNDRWVEDNRIPPRGLVQDVQTDPVGDRYLAQNGVWPHQDHVDYAFAPTVSTDQTPEDPDDDELTIRVRLLYLINTPAYVDFLAEENATNDAGMLVQDVFEDLGGSPPIELASAEVSVPLTGLQEGDGDSGSMDESGESGSTDESGKGGDDGDGGGCGCRSTPDGAPWPGALLLLGLSRRVRPGRRARR